MWVFSDPHFGHQASVGISGRPFRSCHHGDSYLLEQWTHDVQDHDTVICLGDVTMDRPTDGLIDRLRRRPGRKILVAGNHDNAHIRRLRRGFDEVAACAHPPGEPHLLFTHVPLDDIPAGCVNVHGHVHLKTSVVRAPDQRVRRADRIRADPHGGREKAGPPLGPGALGRERHDRPLHRLGEGVAGCRKSCRTGRRAVTGTPDTAERGLATTEPRGRPTLQPDERLWLENYVERLNKAPGGLFKRLVVYGSKARGDAGPTSDVDVLVLVGDTRTPYGARGT